MRPLCLSLAAVLALGAVARADDPSADLLKAYAERLVQMESTAGAHVGLARWCDANGMADRAETHYEEALLFDADCADARAALGYVQRGDEWVLAAEADRPRELAIPYATDLAPDPDPLAEEVLDVYRRLLTPSDPDGWSRGRDRILAMRDRAAATPIARILGGGAVEHRVLACEALAAIPGPEAERLLVRFVLKDPARAVFDAAVDALRLRAPDAGIRQLTRALAGTKRSRQRAAYALGEMRSWQSVPALIGRLKAPEMRVMQAPRSSSRSSGSGAYIAVGTVTTYVADAEPVVAEAAVGWDPVIGSVVTGGVLSVGNPRVIGYRTIIKIIAPQPLVREALKKITGQDFGFEEEEWRSWYGALRREDALP